MNGGLWGGCIPRNTRGITLTATPTHSPTRNGFNEVHWGFDTSPLADNLVFQQEGAPPHYATYVKNVLNTTFPRKWIGRVWPVGSPNLTPSKSQHSFSDNVTLSRCNNCYVQCHSRALWEFLLSAHLPRMHTAHFLNYYYSVRSGIKADFPKHLIITSSYNLSGCRTDNYKRMS